MIDMKRVDALHALRLDTSTDVAHVVNMQSGKSVITIDSGGAIRDSDGNPLGGIYLKRNEWHCANLLSIECTPVPFVQVEGIFVIEAEFATKVDCFARYRRKGTAMTAEPKPDLVELKPCPFCGSKNVKIAAHYGVGRGFHKGETVYSIDCMGCTAAFANRYRREILVEQWNTRAYLEAKEAPAVVDGELPPLPEFSAFGPLADLFTADQMRAYGRQCAAQAISQERTRKDGNGQVVRMPPVEEPYVQINYNEQLSACPMCGSQDVSFCGAASPNEYTWAKCEGCGTQSQKWDRFDKTVAMWNRRTAAPAAVTQELVLKGWKMVPVEPNDAMQAAGPGAIRFDTTVLNKMWTANAVYRAMIAAAPNPPAAHEGDANGAITHCSTMYLGEVQKDAERYRYLRATTTAIRDHATGERIECTPEEFDASIDRCLERDAAMAQKQEKTTGEDCEWQT